MACHTVSADVRIESLDWYFVEGGIRFLIDGEPLLQLEEDTQAEYFEYILNDIISQVLSALETVLESDEEAIAPLEWSKVELQFEPVNRKAIRLRVVECETENLDIVDPDSRNGYVVRTEELCSEVIACARKVAWAIEADAESIDWSDVDGLTEQEIAQFDHSDECHPLREKIGSLEDALEEREQL